MLEFLVHRAAISVVTLFVISLIVFTGVRMIPGDPARVMGGTESDEAGLAEIRAKYGLDDPIVLQYLRWVRLAASGDLGESIRTRESVVRTVARKLPITIELAVLTILGVALIGIPLGVVASVSRSVRVRTLVQIVGVLGLSMPTFWIAILLIIGASSLFGWLPALIYVSPLADPWVNLQQMFLPVLSLSLGLSAVVARMTRSSMLEVLGQDFIRVARAKGLSRKAVLLRHALRNALIPIVTVLGLQTGFLLGGVVITEQIFGLPGLGWTLLNGVYQRDYPVVQGTVMVFAVTFVLINLVVDLLYTYLDPRIRYE